METWSNIHVSFQERKIICSPEVALSNNFCSSNIADMRVFVLPLMHVLVKNPVIYVTLAIKALIQEEPLMY